MGKPGESLPARHHTLPMRAYPKGFIVHPTDDSIGRYSEENALHFLKKYLF